MLPITRVEYFALNDSGLKALGVSMSSKGFLVPIGIAVAALTAEQAPAAVSQDDVLKRATNADKMSASPRPSADPVVGKIPFQIGADEHALVLKRSTLGQVYAQHASHSSHASHASHGSHRSGR